MAEGGRPGRGLTLPRQSHVFFYLLLGLMLYLTWQIFRPFVIFMVAGVFVAVLALPLDRFWERTAGVHRAKKERRVKRRNRFAALLTILTLFLLLTVPLVLLGFALFDDAKTIQAAIRDGAVDTALDDILQTVRPGMNETERNATVAQLTQDLEAQASGFLQGLVAQAPSFLGDVFVGVTVILFVVYYILTDGGRLVGYLKRAAPLPPGQVEHLLHEAHGGLKAVFVGQILTSAIQGALGGIGFLIVGLPGAVLWAAVMAVLSLLPVVGAFLVWVPAVIFLVLEGHTWQPVFLAAWGIIVVSQVDNFVRPRLIGDRADIHPIWVLLGILGGVAAFGFVGLFLGPLLVGVTITLLNVWERDYMDPSLATHAPEGPPEPSDHDDGPSAVDPEDDEPASDPSPDPEAPER